MTLQAEFYRPVASVTRIAIISPCSNMKIFVSFLTVGLVCTAAYGSVLPQDVINRSCHRSDPELNSCLLIQTNKVVKILAKGIPEYKLPALDPLNVEFMTAEGELDAIKIKMVMKNITLTGFSDTKFTKIKFDPESLSGDVSYSIPLMRMTCDYFATGRLFVIPLESSAHFDGNFTGVDMTVSFRLKTVQRKGREYFTIDKLINKMRVNTAKVNLLSIDPAQQQQVSVIQNFFNENDRLVLDTVNPLVNENSNEFFKHIMERYVRRFPTNEVLPK